tara:strand:+ start:105 stop:332 length:228 start_codon:yes stop_codon:yes gene_type:complete
MEKKLKIIFESLFSDKYDGDFKDLKIGDLEKWDSLGNFNLLLSIEKEFNFRFSNEEISELKSIREILIYLKNKNV